MGGTDSDSDMVQIGSYSLFAATVTYSRYPSTTPVVGAPYMGDTDGGFDTLKIFVTNTTAASVAGIGRQSCVAHVSGFGRGLSVLERNDATPI